MQGGVIVVCSLCAVALASYFIVRLKLDSPSTAFGWWRAFSV